jgi:hypothetical protein
MATDHDVTTTPAGDLGEGTGMAGDHAVPGEALSAPSGTPAGPAAHGRADGDQLDGEAAEGETRAFATLEWQMPFWNRPAGHVDRLELTETVRGAVDNGKLVILGEVEHVADPAPGRRRKRK